jgi:hypothetical protein
MRETERSSNLNNEAAWVRVGLSLHRERQKNVSFLCLLIERVAIVKCVEC